MTAVIRTTLAASAALALLALVAAPAEASTHHHHQPAPATASHAQATHHHHHAKASTSSAHVHSRHYVKKHSVGAGPSRGSHKHSQREIVPHPHERHAALCQVVTVHHHAVERCREG